MSEEASPPQSAERWDIFEIVLPGPTEGNPFLDVRFGARFFQKDTVIEAPGFYDGEGIYREHHEIMENFRGREGGVRAAEAFVRLARDGKIDLLPGA